MYYYIILFITSYSYYYILVPKISLNDLIGFKHNINIEVGNSTKIFIFVLMNQESFF